MPQVSIIVPNFNHGQFLERRLDGIFKQTLQDFELIFLDDASTDNSLEVFEAFSSDPRVTCHVNENNSGNPFVQWNRGFDLAKGKYIWIAESDDFAAPRFLEKMIRALKQHPTAGLATCRSFWVDGSGRNLGILDVNYWFRDSDRWREDYFNAGDKEIADYLALQNTIPNASATVIDSRLINNGLRAPENMMLAGDWFFWVSLLSHTDICHLGEPLNYFRQEHQSSQRARTASSGQEVFESMQVYEHVTTSINLSPWKRFKVQTGLMRKWFSVATKYRLGLDNHCRIYQWFFVTKLQSVLAKALQVILASLVLFVVPLTNLPGFRQFVVWIRVRVTGPVSEKEITP